MRSMVRVAMGGVGLRGVQIILRARGRTGIVRVRRAVRDYTRVRAITRVRVLRMVGGVMLHDVRHVEQEQKVDGRAYFSANLDGRRVGEGSLTWT